MGVPLDRAVLAVDGGGTRCRMALEAPGYRFVAEAGPTNVTTDRDGAVQEIRSALSALAEASGESIDDLIRVPAYLGLSGILVAEDIEALRPLLPFAGARIDDDRPAALAGALGPVGSGAIAHCGTGSFLGHRSEGESRFAGGWGHRLGDEASATWLAREALAATLASIDGIGPLTGLTRGLSDRLGGDRGIVDFAESASPEVLGALAPEVTAAAEGGDPVARRIMKAGASSIARTVEAIGWRPGERLCLTGGVGPYYTRYLPAAVRDCLALPLGDPLDGALALAWEFVREQDS